MNLTETNKEQFSFHHIGLIFGVAVLLLGVSWMKNPDLFNVFDGSSNQDISVNIPQYYAYETPAEYNQPLVAGASTENQGPMILNEDGSLAPAVDGGDVLGFSTEDVKLDLDSVKVRIVANSTDSYKQYLKEIAELETTHIQNSDFESALVSGSQSQIDEEANKTKILEENLLNMSVPQTFERIHKLKILQYRSAFQILKNFTKSDENPEVVNNYLQIFLKSEQMIQEEMQNLSNIINNINLSNLEINLNEVK